MRHRQRINRLAPKLAFAAALLLLAASVRAGEWTCQTRSEGSALYFEGGVAGGEYERFKKAWGSCFPSTYRGRFLIDLKSNGGSVDEALEISSFLLRRFEGQPPLLKTRVSAGSACISACTYLFVAGQLREVQGSLEPHGFSSFSGISIRRSLAAAVQLAKSKGWPLSKGIVEGGNLKWVGRGNFVAETLNPVFAADSRFEWVNTHYGNVAKSYEDVVRRAEGYAEMPAERQALIDYLDSVTGTVLPEIERSAALKAFYLQMTIGSGAQSSESTLALLDREDAQLKWAVESYLQGFNRYLQATRSPAQFKATTALADHLLHGLRKRGADVTESVNGQLGPYLARRRNDIDVPAFVKLMFSTSILYTRPLTREELCDHNLVNSGCD